MKFSVLAIDFDGTIAIGDRLDPQVRAALGDLRAHDIVVVLATGRRLPDLQRLVGDLHFVDAVVAENGAVVTFPDSGYTTVNGEAPPPPLIDALRASGVRVDVGRVVLETSADDAPIVLAAIRRLELPLAIAFNRGRLMVLPQTISKATGVRQALTFLRMSPHNAVAIGDAENDHELLKACEVGLAVSWGSAALKAVADYVLTGDGPPAVAAYVRSLLQRTRVPSPIHTRRQLLLGHTDIGDPLALAVRGRNVLVTGDVKSGKSWVTGLLCEQLVLYGYSLCIIDPEGDYVSLEALPGVVVLGGADPLPRPRDLLRSLRHADVSPVIDLSHVTHAEKIEYVHNLLPALATLRHHTGLPHRIVLDEAHYFLHDADVPALLDIDQHGYTLVSYRSTDLHPRLLASSEAIVVTRASDPREVAGLFDRCRSCAGRRSEAEWAQLLGSLSIGEAVVLPITQEAAGDIRRIRLAPRLTPHVRHLAKYIDIPVMDSRAFVFWEDGRATNVRPRTLRAFVEALETAPPAAIDGHLRRGDFSRWIRDVFGDYPLAQTIADIERAYAAGQPDDAAGALSRAVRSRYEFLEPLPHQMAASAAS
jgi:hydroxymethylpyrimidine pyrophosphatase-like HAD family hydrolase